MIVKVCGMRDPENIRAVADLGVDMMGFIFWEKTPRNVRHIDVADLPDCKRVGVFVNETAENVFQKVHDYHLDFVQLHGSESPEYIDALRSLLSADTRVIKALRIREDDDVRRWREYDGHVDMLLFDTKCKCVGGSGEKFDWDVLRNYDGNIPFLLSGGIAPDDVGRVMNYSHPMCAGIDLNSRFEDAPALKNVERLKQFIYAIKENK